MLDIVFAQKLWDFGFTQAMTKMLLLHRQRERISPLNRAGNFRLSGKAEYWYTW